MHEATRQHWIKKHRGMSSATKEHALTARYDGGYCPYEYDETASHASNEVDRAQKMWIQENSSFRSWRIKSPKSPWPTLKTRKHLPIRLCDVFALRRSEEKIPKQRMIRDDLYGLTA